MYKDMKREERYIDCLKTTVTFCIGQNAKDNHDLIDASNPDDMWFHIHDSASCHVVAIIHNLDVTKQQLTKIVIQGALLCKQHSKQKSQRNTHIMYSKLNNVSKTKKVGAVNVSDYKLISL
jgi:predicted ribosome quality control (RQC) complex YloA/Tae2 family protein